MPPSRWRTLHFIYFVFPTPIGNTPEPSFVFPIPTGNTPEPSFVFPIPTENTPEPSFVFPTPSGNTPESFFVFSFPSGNTKGFASGSIRRPFYFATHAFSPWMTADENPACSIAFSPRMV